MLKLFFDFAHSLYALVYEPIPITSKNESNPPGKFSMAANHGKRITRLRVRPVVILLILIFLFFFNAIIVYSYGIGHENKQIHTNVLIYMYLYFWITFFLIAYQITQITKQADIK
jgi:hypothetical protein